tara:strand:- start:466 stop:1008 length:543 start_codon:yes stop_codon:yes gene_type:complete
MSKIFFFILINIICFTSCNETKPRKQINFHKQSFLNKSVTRNIEIKKKEEIYFNNIIKEDSESKYFSSSRGFWFKILTTSKSNLKPKKGDEVVFSYNVFDLEGNDIYKDDELKPIRYVVDKEEIIAALRYGIKELKIGESGVFLMPSFFCYGYQGDGEKIIPNQPLIVQINLISLKQNTY